MKKRTVAIVGVGLVALGMWLGKFLKFPGLGSGGTIGNPPPATPSESDLVGQQVSLSTPRGGGDVADEAGDDVLDVLVAGEGYQVKTGAGRDAWKVSDLKEIADLATDRAGDARGVRVRVHLDREATNGARSDLYQALEIIGIEKDAVHQLPGFVD